MNAAAARPYAYSLGLHVAVGLLLVVGVTFTRPNVVSPAPVQAVVVDRTVMDALATQRRIDNQQAQAAAARLAAQQREQQMQLEQQRQQQAQLEQQRQLQAAAAEKEHARQQAVLEAQRQAQVAAAAKRKAEQEAAARQAREQAEARKQAEAAAAARRKAEADARAQARREADLQARLADEERHAAAVASGMQAQYVALLTARIERNWNRPPTAKPGLKCTVKVVQIPGGEVVSAALGDCNGDEAVKQSIITAVLRASPLPAPPDPSLFTRNLNFVFEPKD